jgi:sensor c-di-GMP phosphodiesterase-like protein
VIAEGVEDDATSQALIELGCDVAQGWKYSKAIPADEWPQWLEKAPVASLSE